MILYNITFAIYQPYLYFMIVLVYILYNFMMINCYHILYNGVLKELYNFHLKLVLLYLVVVPQYFYQLYQL